MHSFLPGRSKLSALRIRRHLMFHLSHVEVCLLWVQAKHRRLRRWDALWAVHDLSAKWRAMVKRRERRMEAFRLAQARCEVLIQQQDAGEPDSQLEELQQAIQSCIAEAAEADSMEVQCHHTPFTVHCQQRCSLVPNRRCQHVAGMGNAGAR